MPGERFYLLAFIPKSKNQDSPELVSAGLWGQKLAAACPTGRIVIINQFGLYI